MAASAGENAGVGCSGLAAFCNAGELTATGRVANIDWKAGCGCRIGTTVDSRSDVIVVGAWNVPARSPPACS